MHSWSKLCTKRYKKTPNPAATSEEPGAKAGYCTCNLHTPPPKRWANHLSHSSSPNPGHTPSLTLYKEPAHFPSPSGSKHGNPENIGKRFHFTLWRLGSGVEESCLQRSLKVHCTCSFYFHGTRRSPTQSLWPPPILAQGALGLLLQMLCHTPPCTFPLYSNPSLMISSLSTLFLTAYLNPREHKGPALPGLEGETRVSATRNPGLSLYGRGPWHQRGQGLAQDHTASQRQVQIQRFLLTACLQCSVLPASHSALAELQTHILTWT